uniref:NADH-ubiquinone oxidoreductase chain 4 n=1 Tax=Macromia manchurica TaxID=1389456 RepID=A0A8F9WI44_9ODON|nr:NADH dehydrogenase subunit 4 [Macromia manchurica]
MLKFLFFVLFLTPLSFFVNYWVFLSFLLMGSFLFLIKGYLVYPFSNFGFYFGEDNLSYGLILLSFWICCLMLLASSGIYKIGNFTVLFLIMNMILLSSLILAFMSSSLFTFYLFFESSLIPTFFLVLGWGYQPERVQAGIYLLFYTLFASLPLLVAIFFLYNWTGTLNMFLYSYIQGLSIGVYLYLPLVFAFLVKMPMFIFHLWLPKAHVEAPVSGSMILAGVLLKLGGYGLFRSFGIIFGLGKTYNYMWMGIALMGGLIVSLICLCQMDLKSLIAYSSVAHMGIALAGIMTMTYWGMSGAYGLMIAHGLCSSGLFCLANISYERLGSRSMMINKGLMNIMPSMCLWWFLLSSANMAAPPTLNLLSEISLLNSIISWSWMTIYSVALLSFFSAAYTLYLYSYTQHGKFYSSLYSCNSGYYREYLLLLLHWLPLNIIILKPDLFFIWL